MSGSNHTFDISYQNTQNNCAKLTSEQIEYGEPPASLSRIRVSALWQLTPKWSLAGLCNSNFPSRHTRDISVGVQYESCSWAIQLWINHYLSDSNNANKPSKINDISGYNCTVQFELKGLGGGSMKHLDQSLSIINRDYEENLFN